MADSKRTAQLTLLIKEAGAKETAAEIKKLATTTTSVQTELAKLSRADQLQKLGTEMGALAKKTGDVSGAVADLNKKLVALGTTKDEIRGVASAFSQAQNADIGSGGGPGGNLLQRIGAQGRNLPSVQIPGAGIGTDAISNLIRLSGALGEATGAAGLMSSVTTALVPTLGATAAGFAGVAVVLGPIVIIAGIVVAALKSIGDQAAAEAKAINAIVDAQRSVAQEIAAGLTTEDAQEKLKTLNEQRRVEAELLARNQQVYDENINNAGALSGVLKLTSGAEEALATQLQSSKDAITANETETAALTRALENGSLAANDAAVAEEKLAQERSKAALTSADTAGKELAAQQKALAATGEQNEKRLTAITDEKAVIEAQIASLTESGVTSEEVTAKIEALNAQLGFLGKESDFITNTALAQSKARDAEKQAQKDAEDAAKKAAAAQEQYTKAVDNARLSYRNAVQDIGTRLTNALTDNTTKLNRDLLGLDSKFKQEEFDLNLKASRDERNEALKQSDELKSIREDARKEELQALQDGDFKALFLARQKGQEELKQETQQDQQDDQRRRLSFQDASEDLRRSIERQREQRQIAARYQESDARLAQTREIQQAQLARNRALSVAAEAQNASLTQLKQFWQNFGAITQNGMTNALQAASGGGMTRTGANTNPNLMAFQQVIRR